MFGLVVQSPTLKHLHEYSSLLLVSVAPTMAMPAVVTLSATIGRLSLTTAAAHSASTSASAMMSRACFATAVRLGTLSVASRTNKSTLILPKNLTASMIQLCLFFNFINRPRF